MTAAQVFDLLQAKGVSAGLAPDAVKTIVFDKDYALTTRRWIAGPFTDALRAWFKLLRLDQPVPQRKDCDKYAWIARGLAMAFHAGSTTNNVALLVLFVGYLNQQSFPPDPHAIIAFVVEEDSAPDFVFYDPMLYRIVDLAPEEIASVNLREF